MTIIEMLKALQYNDEFINDLVDEAYESYLRKIPKKKSFSDSKIVKFFSSKNKVDYIISKSGAKQEYKQYLKETKETFEKIRNGEITDSNEIYEFYDSHDIDPIETIKKEDGSYTYIYEDGFMIDNVTSKGIYKIEKYPNIRKKLVAHKLNLSEEEVLNMTDDEILEIVKKLEQRKKGKRLEYNSNN